MVFFPKKTIYTKIWYKILKNKLLLIVKIFKGLKNFLKVCKYEIIFLFIISIYLNLYKHNIQPKDRYNLSKSFMNILFQFFLHLENFIIWLIIYLNIFSKILTKTLYFETKTFISQLIVLFSFLKVQTIIFHLFYSV